MTARLSPSEAARRRPAESSVQSVGQDGDTAKTRKKVNLILSDFYRELNLMEQTKPMFQSSSLTVQMVKYSDLLLQNK